MTYDDSTPQILLQQASRPPLRNTAPCGSLARPFWPSSIHRNFGLRRPRHKSLTIISGGTSVCRPNGPPDRPRPCTCSFREWPLLGGQIRPTLKKLTWINGLPANICENLHVLLSLRDKPRSGHRQMSLIRRSRAAWHREREAPLEPPHINKTTRRAFLTAAAAGTALMTTGATSGAKAQVATKAKIVIIGAGAGGTALANRLVRRLDGAEITLVDPRKDHLYQPGLSLVAAGLKPAGYVVSKTTDWLPGGVKLVQEPATVIDPVAKTVATADNQTLSYDFLVLAPGLTLDHDAIEGFSLDMVGQNGIGALYAGPEYAARTWAAASQFSETGGVGLFTRPATEMKCAGAPLKHTFLIDDITRRAGNRARPNSSMPPRKGGCSACPSSPRKCACSLVTAASTSECSTGSNPSTLARNAPPSPTRTVSIPKSTMIISTSSRPSVRPR